MAEIVPFKAFRYNPEKVKMEEVAAPPYDVISPKYRDELYEKHEHNVIRLILGKEEKGDTERENKYVRAKKHLADWIKEDILLQDAEPAFYLYRQSFKHPETGKNLSRHAFFAALRLEDFDKKVVIPHEKTYDQPKMDRLNLMKETRTNLSPIFGLYDDHKGEISRVFEFYLDEPYLFNFTDDQRVTHTMWKVVNKEDIEKITELFADKKVIIADGHHRYETALEYRNLEHGKEDKPGNYDYVMMALADFQDEGLIILPTHRLVKDFPHFNPGKLLKDLEMDFDIKHVQSEHILGELRDCAPEDKVFGLHMGPEHSYRLRLKDKKVLEEHMPKEKSKEWKELEASILSYLILERHLGISPGAEKIAVEYTHSADDAYERVDREDAQMAFILREPDIKEVENVCEKGERMPQKSTYFYPKLPSGLVMRMH